MKTITVKQFKSQHAELKHRVQQAMDKDSEVTINGNGCNAFEVWNAIKRYDELISQLKD